MSKNCGMVLAAGKGTRMKSEMPKVLHEVNGVPMVFLSLDRLQSANVQNTVVVIGYKGEMVKEAIDKKGYKVILAQQDEQLGTGHAVKCGMDAVPQDCTTVVVTYGDNPFIPTDIFNQLIAKRIESGAIGVISAVFFDDPMGPAFGRIKRDESGKICAIVEQKNASEDELKIQECNGGPIAYDAHWLRGALPRIKRNEVSGEYYLTDLVELAYAEGELVESVRIEDIGLAMGVNTLDHLAEAQKVSQKVK
jgi:bifunctional UDP-N-acetylglucosamine pyrophosphorylase/glucosamine-1-phosphate N-acetyltransferase